MVNAATDDNFIHGRNQDRMIAQVSNWKHHLSNGEHRVVQQKHVDRNEFYRVVARLVFQ
jgi:hypothetical protein